MRGVVPLPKPCLVCASDYWCGEACARQPRGIEPERPVGSVGCEQCRKLGEEVARLKALLEENRLLGEKSLAGANRLTASERQELFRKREKVKQRRDALRAAAKEMAMDTAEMALRISRAARAAGIVNEESSAPSDEIPF